MAKHDIPIKTESYADVLVGLDYMISNPGIFESKLVEQLGINTILLPWHYLDRLLELRKDEESNKYEAVKILIKQYRDFLSCLHRGRKNSASGEGLDFIYLKNGTKLRLIKEQEALRMGKSNTRNTVKTALWCKENLNDNLAILTGDDGLAALSLMNDIDVLETFNDNNYTGRRKLTIKDDDAVLAWVNKGYLTLSDFKKYFPDEKNLVANEFVEFVFDESAMNYFNVGSQDIAKRIGRFEVPKDNNEPYLQQLHYVYDSEFIRPRTAGQAMLMEALLAPLEEIPIVICASPFGTGKTFLTTGIGAETSIFRKKHKLYKDGIVVVPRDSKIGEPIGFEPGNKFYKTLVKIAPIVDNLLSYLKLRGNKAKGGEEKSSEEVKNDAAKILEKYFDLSPIIYTAGRNLKDSYIIYDEFQEMELLQAAQLMGRIGEDSKMVITGDPSQIYNRHLSQNHNGLTYAMNGMRGSRLTAIITLNEDEVVRSEAAKEIAKFLNSKNKLSFEK